MQTENNPSQQFAAPGQPSPAPRTGDQPAPAMPPGYAPQDEQHYAPDQPAYAPPAGPTKPQQDVGKWLSIAALALAVVALALCLVPVINHVAIALAIVGLGLGGAALTLAVKRKAKTGLPIAALVTAGLAVTGFMVSRVFYAVMLTGLGVANGDGGEGVGGAASVDEREEQRAQAGPRMALGEAADVGTAYKVTVNALKQDATDEILAVNSFNQAPLQGQYALVDLTAEYVGPGEGDPSMDLSVRLSGGDARQYDARNCRALLGKPTVLVPTLENGGQADFQVCLDIPAEALRDAELLVEPRMSLNGESRVYWTLE